MNRRDNGASYELRMTSYELNRRDAKARRTKKEEKGEKFSGYSVIQFFGSPIGRKFGLLVGGLS